ncbi:MAG TPA: gliding motility-associated C-terminal domain-containing protein [Hymenobacter sp.]|uniref:T9SS type B sorting domain-containing protein n=1 Tax=Hymenobacter sp. TaxID=1898978 RepID=UPI002D7F4E52|nr:gliding motility-associated C-terminal domain-containing protein [Hymenobacter sp.]HET9505757.1 gliding motility-associated C-terminal domain-containing protein [Hymenobacter sp.]
MTATLLRRAHLLPWLVLLLTLLGGARPALASHLLGGELTYKYLNAAGPAATPYRYEITLTIYTNCNSSVGAPTAAGIYIYNQATGALLASPSVARTFISPACVTVPVPLGCTNTGATQQPFKVNRYVTTVSLPAATNGYYAYFTSGNRNAGIANIATPDYEYLTLYATLARPALANSSPVFATDALAVLCAADTTVVLNNAVDVDGDRLEYSLATPYSASNYPTTFALPLTTVTYNPTYSNVRPLGASPNSAKINASSGISKFYATSTGSQYAVAIDVKEYRTIGGVETLIGTTRRDVQLIVGSCPPTMPPVLPTSAVMPRSYTIEAGSTLSIPITATQPDSHPLTLMASSTLLDGAGGYAATFGGNAGTPLYAGSPLGSHTVAGTTNGTVAGTFVFTPACTDVRSTPYDVTLLVNDIGCAGKLRSEVLRITVVKPTGPTTIAGNLAVCGLGTTQSYTATGGNASRVAWTVTGGTIVGSATANPVQVLWPTAGAGTLTAQGSTQYGCLADAVTKNVTINPAATLTVTGNLTICQGGSASVSIVGGTAPYLLTGGGAAVTGAGLFVLRPSQTTTYTVANAVAPASGCLPTGQFTITVNPLPVATAGAAVALCAGNSAQLGAAPVAGTTYSWSPATGLSNASVANPTVTLPNTAGVPITQTYTLTATNAVGCQASSSVVVTVAPPPVANAGAAIAFCAGGTGQLGAAPAAGLAYSWSPATGLSNATSANPTVTLPNATGAPITKTYTLTVTNAAGCTSTGTAAVTVHPAPVATAGPATTFCAGGSAQLGAAPVAGTTYSWSPATGLSNASVANPTVTLPNVTGTAATHTYTLTATNAAGCASTAVVAVTVLPLPVAVPGAAKAICSGGSAQLGAVPLNSLTYSWSPATGLSSASAANPTVTLPNLTGAPITHTYTLTVTSGAGCTSTGTVVVTVNPLPVANAGAAVSLCAGSAGQLGAAPVAGLTYSWSPATGLSSSTVANPTVTLANATGAPLTQTYTLTATNAAGCASTSTVLVTVSSLPTANAGAAVAFCTGGSGQLGAAPVAGLTYSWSPATGLSNATSANPTVTLTNATGAPITQTYTLTATNATGCASTATVAVTVSPPPLAVTGAALTRCSGNAGQLGAAPVAGTTYSWSPAAGLSNASVANPTVTLTNATSTAATHTYTLTVTSAGGCTNTGTVAVTVLPALLPGSIGADQTVCAGALPALLTSLSAAGGGPGTYTYQWESSADNLTWTALANVTTPTCAPGPVAATTYFRRRVVASCGTAYSNVVTVTTQPLLVPAVALPVLPAQCAGTAFTFTPVPTNAGNNPTYQWFVNGTAVGTGPSYTSSTLRDGDLVRVVLTPTAGFCASGPAIATARVSLTPVLISSVKIAATTTLPACPGEVVAFGIDAVANIGTSPQYQWQVDGVSIAGATGPRFSSRTLHDGQAVTLLVRSTDACGQPATATSNAVRVSINQPVALSAGPDKTITEGESVVLEGTASGSAFAVWSPTQTLTFASGDRLRPTAAPLVTTTYTLSAGAGGCASTSQVTVTVLPRLRIPNVFSPNGDNNDDTWQIDNLDAYPNSRVVVFNRWGAKIFEATNYARGSEWRGTINGQPVPFGTYYYVITLGNGKSFTGPLTVIN